MKNIVSLLFLLTIGISSYAQTDKDDRKQEIRDNAQEKKTISKEKVDYNLFRRQMLALKEYSDERKKIPALQKASKMPVKVIAYVDSLDGAGDNAENKTLIGYITEIVGDNATNIYETTYDRALKKIITVKATGETSDIEQEETGTKKTIEKKSTAKKAKDDDDDDDADDDKPVKKKDIDPNDK